MVKRLIPVLFSIVCLAHPSFAQKPTILSVDKNNGGLQEVVTIKGSDFGIDKTKLKVMFGAVSGEIKEIGNQLLEVRTPAGTTYDNISVTNITTRLTGYSPSSYSLNFNGADALTQATFGGADVNTNQSNFQAAAGLYDLCLCDFDGDGKTDIGTASDNSSSLAIFKNNSTIGSVVLTATPPHPTHNLIQASSLHSTCGDLNGDGLPDMVVSEGGDGDRLYIFRNTGGLTFNITILKINGRKVKRVVIADLDLNGKPELVVTDKGSNIITILPNTTTVPTSITFAAPVNVTVTGAITTDALEIKDVNGNGLPDIVTSQFLTDISGIFICDNKSSPGIFNFSDITTLPVSSTVVNVRVGDLDGDSKPDIAATRLLGNDIVVFRNIGNGSQVAFSSPTAFVTNNVPWGLDFGDLNGDGKTDIAVATIGAKSITVLVNQSSGPGSLAFATMLTLPAKFINRHVKIGDVDGDAKPDLVFASVDDNASNPTVAASMISVKRNQSCFVPEVTPEGPLEFCTGSSLELISSAGGGVTYDWKKNGSSELSGPDAKLDVTVSGGYTVTAISESGACSKISNTVNVTFTAPSGSITPGTPVASSNTPVCTDDVLNLAANATGASKFVWSGPDGFTAEGVTPSVSNFTLQKAGVYIVKIFAGDCVALTDSTIVEGIDNPDFSLTFSGEALICQGSSKTLTVSPVLTSGFSYKWFEQTQGELSGQTNSTLVRTTSGNYYAQVISAHPGCSPVETEKVNLTAVAVPVASFTPSASPVCVNQVITFANQSTVDPAATPSYKWTFGDATPNSTEISPQKSYAAASTFPVKLVVTYQGGECPDDETKLVTVTPSPAISITAADDNFDLCTGDTLRLGVTGDTFSDYEWSTGATTPTILIEEPIEYGVTVTTSAGCILEVKQLINEVEGPTVIATADKTTIKVNESTVLHATGDGLVSYLWQPGLSLKDSTIANPVAEPLQDIVYTVSGVDEKGCRGEASIEIKVLGTSVFDLLIPDKYFSPNGDASNPVWEVEKIESFPTCSVTIYNDKGSKVYESKPFVSWDGTYKGSKLPSGVYYYVIRCDGESKAKTGSITLLK